MRMYGVLLAAALANGALASSPSPADTARGAYVARYASRAVPMLCELIRFRTVAGNLEAFREQRNWLAAAASRLGFVFRDGGPVTEVELPGPPGAPVLGLVIHGNQKPVKTGKNR